MSTAKPFYWPERKGWYLWTVGDNGKRSRIRLADTKTVAFQVWREGLQRAEKAANDPEFVVLAGQWLERQEARFAQEQVSQSWLERVSQTIARFCADHPGLTVSQLTPAIAESWHGGKVSSSYERTELGTLKQCLKWCARSGLIERSPLELMQLATAGRRTELVTGADHAKLVSRCGSGKYAGRKSRCFRQILISAWLTGARPTELRKVRWSEVDPSFSRAVMVKHKTARKISKPRTIYYSPCGQTLLRILRAQRPTDSDFVFLNSRGKRWTKSAIVLRMGRLSKDTGIPVVAYTYRHAYATRAIMAGVDTATVAEILGTSITMIERHYGHLAKQHDHLMDAVQRVAATGKGR